MEKCPYFTGKHPRFCPPPAFEDAKARGREREEEERGKRRKEQKCRQLKSKLGPAYNS